MKVKKMMNKEKICQAIRDIFEKNRGVYGSPRVYQELKKMGLLVSENTVAKYMREMEIDARLKKKFRVQTTDSKHPNPIAPRVFKIEEKAPSTPRKTLAGDITYVRCGDEFLYLAVVLDLYNRECLGWALMDHMPSELVLKAMDNALIHCSDDTEIIFHSDRGSQYASDAYQTFLNEKEIISSMSRKGNCYDNAYVESFFKTLKTECIYRKKFLNYEEIRMAIFEYIEGFYNCSRIHSSLGYLSPREYREIKFTA